MSGTVLNTDDTRVLKIKSLIKKFTSEEGKLIIMSCKIFDDERHEKEQTVDKGRAILFDAVPPLCAILTETLGD